MTRAAVDMTDRLREKFRFANKRTASSARLYFAAVLADVFEVLRNPPSADISR